MKMPWNHDVGLLATIIDWLKSNSTTIYAAILSGLIGYVRLIYDGIERKNKWLESILCGALLLTITSLLDYFGLPQSLAPFAGGMVGLIGFEQLRELAIKFLKNKVGDNNDDV